MSKAKTHAQRLRERRERRHIAEGDPHALAPVKAREPNGRPSRGGKPRGDESIPAYEVRLRHMGIAKTEQAMRDARAHWNGCEAGRAMASLVKNDSDDETNGYYGRSTMWSTIQHMRRTVAAYDAAIGAPLRHAQSLRLLLPLEAMETDAAAPPADLRDDDEKYRQAISGWMRMHGWLGRTDSRAASICLQTVIDNLPCRDSAALVRALHCVADGIQGNSA